MFQVLSYIFGILIEIAYLNNGGNRVFVKKVFKQDFAFLKQANFTVIFK